VAVPICPVCGSAAASVMHQGLTDRVFGVAPGEWRLVRCDGCGAARLDPCPADDALASLYARYYTHAAAVPTSFLDPARASAVSAAQRLCQRTARLPARSCVARRPHAVEPDATAG